MLVPVARDNSACGDFGDLVGHQRYVVALKRARPRSVVEEGALRERRIGRNDPRQQLRRVGELLLEIGGEPHPKLVVGHAANLTLRQPIGIDTSRGMEPLGRPEEQDEAVPLAVIGHAFKQPAQPGRERVVIVGHRDEPVRRALEHDQLGDIRLRGAWTAPPPDRRLVPPGGRAQPARGCRGLRALPPQVGRWPPVGPPTLPRIPRTRCAWSHHFGA